MTSALTHVSASAISSYNQCARRYIADKKLGIREEESAAMALGTKIHGELEAFVEKGVIPTHPSARLVLEHPDVPKRGPGLLAEFPSSWFFTDPDGNNLLAAGVKVKGRIDLLHAASDTFVRILDWKTRSNLKYAPTATALESDVQGTIYSKAVFTRFPTVERVVFTHANILSNPEAKPAVKVVSTREMDRSFIDDKFAVVEAVVSQMKDVMALENIEDVPGNPEACFAYRKRCPFAAQCSVFRSHHGEARDVLDPVEDDETPTTPGARMNTSLKELLAQKRAGSTTPTEPPPRNLGEVTAAIASILPPDAPSPTPAPLPAVVSAVEDRLVLLERRQSALAERIAALEGRTEGKGA